MRIRYNPEARPELAAWEYYIDEPEKLRGHWAEQFPRRQPMVLELGCGKGGFLAQMAPAHPEKNYIALDLKSEMLVLAKRKAEGCISVEMESAGVQAMCSFRGLQLYAFFTSGDLFDAPKWDARMKEGQVKHTQHDPGHFEIALALAQYVSER